MPPEARKISAETKTPQSSCQDSRVGERMKGSPLSSLSNGSRSDRQQALILGFVVGATPALMALVPWDFGTEMNNYRALMRGYSIVVLIVELVVIIWALKHQIKYIDSFRNFPAFDKIGLALLAGIAVYTSLFVAMYPVSAFIGLDTWLLHILFGMAVYHIGMRKLLPDLTSIWIAVSIGILTYLMVIAVYISTIDDPDNFRWAGLIPGVPNIRSTGFFSIVGFAAGAAISFGSLRRFHFLLGLIFAAAAFGLAVWSATRGAIFAIFVAVAFLFVWRSEFRNRRFTGWVFSAIVIGVLLSAISYKPNDQFGLARLLASVENSGGSIDRLSAGRVQIWKETVHEVAKRPIFGYGERQFRYVGASSGRGLNQPHNIFLQIAFQWGIAGALLFFLLLTRLGTLVWRRTNRGKNLGMGEQMLIISTLVYSLYDAALFYPYPIMMFTLVVALAVASANQPAPAVDRSD